ncbi:MAG: hypothetical protein PVI50_04795 [Gammaproteobacteria bacterium]|jgi:hypothetical protein
MNSNQAPVHTGDISRWPGILLAALLLVPAVLLSPAILEEHLALDWRAGDMRHVAYGLQLLFGALSVTTFLARRRAALAMARLLRNRRRLFAGLFLVTISTLVAIGLSEAVLRIVDLPFRELRSPPEYQRAQFDSETGWSYLPDTALDVEFHAVETPIPVYTDSRGIRVGAPGQSPDTARPSILFVGGSYTFGAGLSYEDTLPGQMERLPDFPLQPVNLGVEAYGTDQSLLRLKRFIDVFNTRVVVYSFIPDHVNRNANYDRRELIRGARFKGTKPLFALEADGMPYLSKAPRLYEDYHYSRLWAFVRLFWQRWGPGPRQELTRGLIREMNRLAESRGATLIVVDWNWDRPAAGSPIAALTREGIHLVDTARNAPPGWIRWWNNGWNIPDDSHPNAKANARIARLVYEQMKQLNLVGP